MTAADVVPVDADLPGGGWLAIDEGLSAPGGDGPGAMFDCVGPEFPEDAVVASASSPHFLRPPGRLVHGIGVEFGSADAAAKASVILAGVAFAECLGRSVAADLVAGADAGTIDAELLAVDVEVTGTGHRVRFTGGDARGLRPVTLEITTVHAASSVGVLWCGDTPGPFPADDLGHLLGRVRARAGG